MLPPRRPVSESTVYGGSSATPLPAMLPRPRSAGLCAALLACACRSAHAQTWPPNEQGPSKPGAGALRRPGVDETAMLAPCTVNDPDDGCLPGQVCGDDPRDSCDAALTEPFLSKVQCPGLCYSEPKADPDAPSWAWHYTNSPVVISYPDAEGLAERTVFDRHDQGCSGHCFKLGTAVTYDHCAAMAITSASGILGSASGSLATLPAGSWCALVWIDPRMAGLDDNHRASAAVTAHTPLPRPNRARPDCAIVRACWAGVLRRRRVQPANRHRAQVSRGAGRPLDPPPLQGRRERLAARGPVLTQSDGAAVW